MNEVKLHVGDVDEMGKRFIEAWKRLEAGHPLSKSAISLF